jgi:hypothetical protein
MVLGAMAWAKGCPRQRTGEPASLFAGAGGRSEILGGHPSATVATPLSCNLSKFPTSYNLDEYSGEGFSPLAKGADSA